MLLIRLMESFLDFKYLSSVSLPVFAISALTVSKIFNQNGLRIFDIEELTTHGGSLRIFGCHLGASQCLTRRAKSILAQEYEHGLNKLSYYEKFQARTDKIKDEFLNFLIDSLKNSFVIDLLLTNLSP